MIIRIKNLRAETIIGVHEWEKLKPRELVINVEMEFSGTKNSDNLSDTLDYDTISQFLIAEIKKSRFNLIEKLAEVLIARILEDKRISRAKIEIDKPGAIKNAESVSVVYEKSK